MKSRSIILFFVLILAISTVTTAVEAPLKPIFNKKPVWIFRDDYGVPHVYGSTLESLFYGVGYAQAQDRLWQADLYRRLATGTLAEFFGEDSVPGDIFARKMFGSAERRAALLETITADGLIILQAFTNGINAWIQEATASGQLPLEYNSVQGLTVRPWTIDDSVAIFMFLGSQFGWFGSEELDNATHLQELIAIHGTEEGIKVFADTHWLHDPDAPTTVPNEGTINPIRQGFEPRFELPEAILKAADDFDQVLEGWKKNQRKIGIGKGPSSNAIALAPKLTTDGHALLLGGPQMGYSTPQINHEVGIHGVGFHVTGTQIAGLPGVQIGVTQKFAWTITSGLSDNSDIYQEEVNEYGQYLFDGEYLDYDCREETINVLGGSPLTVQVKESVHGPVLLELPTMAYSFKNSTRGREMISWEAWINVSRAQSIDDFGETLREIAYNFNVLYADAPGNIAYWHIGKIPIRTEGDNPWLPHNGTGVSEWQGYLPWEKMPHVLNPSQGWLTSWNNKPIAGWENSVAGFGIFGPVHRVNTLIKLLQDLKPHSATLATLEYINQTAGLTTDTPSGSSLTVFVSTLLDGLIAHIEEKSFENPIYRQIVNRLEKWDWLQIDADSDGFYDQPEVAIFNTWWQKLVERVFTDDLGTTGQPNVISNLVARLIDENPAVPLLHDYLDGETIEDVVTQTFKDTVDQYFSSNPDPDSWLQPAAYINWAPLGIGSVSDPYTIWMNRGTYNQLIHLGEDLKLYGKNIVAPGQSGDPRSPHFADQLELYATWTYKPMILKLGDLLGHTEDIICLRIP